MEKYLKPGNLALGENNAKLNIWHGRYNGCYEDTLKQGFFKAYFKSLMPGDLVYLVVNDGEVDLIQFLITKNSASPDERVARDEFIETKVISTTRKSDLPGIDADTIKELKRQLKAELARTYALNKVSEEGNV